MSKQKVDESAANPAWMCARCPNSHRPGSACPPVGVWLVLKACPNCGPEYCWKHRGRA